MSDTVKSLNTVAQWAVDAVKARPFDQSTMRGECVFDRENGVRLIQTGKDRFTVVYGKEVKTGLTYAQAGSAYGLAIMHALACEGLLDNRARGER
jgi:hypothetical protein